MVRFGLVSRTPRGTNKVTLPTEMATEQVEQRGFASAIRACDYSEAWM
jgi:hypothetical protein